MDFSKTKDEKSIYIDYLENQIKGTKVDDAVEALELLVEALKSKADFFSDLKTRILQKNLDFEKVCQSVEAGYHTVLVPRPTSGTKVGTNFQTKFSFSRKCKNGYHFFRKMNNF